jgi:ribosomal-protein-alanine N-acetyltransferase
VCTHPVTHPRKPIRQSRCEALAALHALAFTDAPRPWTAGEFRALLDEHNTLLATRDGGLAVGRLAGPEAELLTVAVHPEARRRGLGSALVRAIEAAAARGGAEECLLEVAVTNAPALALYAALGYAPVGRRPRYYLPAASPPVDALILRKWLASPGRGKTI